MRNYLLQTLMLQAVITLSFLNSYAFTEPENKPATKSDSVVIKKVIALNDSGVYYWRKKEYQQALNLFHNALQISEQNVLKNQIASELNNIGLVYYSQGDYAQCLDYYNRSISVLRQTGDSMKIAQSLMNTGIVYHKQGIYDKATAFLLEAVRYFEKNKRLSQLASCYNTLANSQSDLGYYNEALKYHFKALDIRREIGDSTGIATSTNNIGITYKKLDSLDLALMYFNQSLNVKSKSGDEKLLPATLSNIGDILKLKHDYKNAEIKYLESYRLRKQINDQNGLISVSNKLGELYLQTGLSDKAETLLEEGYNIARKINSNELELNNLKLQAQLYEFQNQFKKAVESYKKYDTLRSRIFDSEKAKAISELRIKYETEKNETEIKTLNAIRETQASQIKIKTKMQHALLFGLTMFIILTLVIFRAYQQKRKSNNQIRILMQERQHRAKNNLQIITELLGLQSAYLEHEQAKGAIKSGENRMQAVSMIDKMLYQNPNDTKIDMYEYTQKLVGNLTFLFDGNGQKVNTNLHVEHFLLDAAKATPLGLILNELVTNSFKYAFKGCLSPELNIELTQNDEKQIILSFSDNGPGLNENIEFGKLNSLGLKLIHSLSRQLKGTLAIENRNGFYCNLIFNA